MKERKSHFETIKVDLLSPFLFCGTYRDKFVSFIKSILIIFLKACDVISQFETYL